MESVDAEEMLLGKCEKPNHLRLINSHEEIYELGTNLITEQSLCACIQ